MEGGRKMGKGGLGRENRGQNKKGKRGCKDVANGVLPVPVLVNVAAGSEEMKGATVPTIIRAITTPMAIFLEKNVQKHEKHHVITVIKNAMLLPPERSHNSQSSQARPFC
jgi:hypothetical protein